MMVIFRFKASIKSLQKKFMVSVKNRSENIMFHMSPPQSVLNQAVSPILTAKEPAFSQENWFKCGTNTLLI